MTHNFIPFNPEHNQSFLVAILENPVFHQENRIICRFKKGLVAAFRFNQRHPGFFALGNVFRESKISIRIAAFIMKHGHLHPGQEGRSIPTHMSYFTGFSAMQPNFGVERINLFFQLLPGMKNIQFSAQQLVAIQITVHISPGLIDKPQTVVKTGHDNAFDRLLGNHRQFLQFFLHRCFLAQHGIGVASGLVQLFKANMAAVYFLIVMHRLPEKIDKQVDVSQ